jgi:hypothetical protein
MISLEKNYLKLKSIYKLKTLLLKKESTSSYFFIFLSKSKKKIIEIGRFLIMSLGDFSEVNYGRNA